MMPKTSPLTGLRSDPLPHETDVPAEGGGGKPATIWVARITSIVGLLCLALALAEWGFRQGHLRTVLALLTIAMFAAILHSYTFEDGS